FQAEDGIRDRNVTGVQTCALPISISKTETSPTTALFRCPRKGTPSLSSICNGTKELLTSHRHWCRPTVWAALMRSMSVLGLAGRGIFTHSIRPSSGAATRLADTARLLHC